MKWQAIAAITVLVAGCATAAHPNAAPRSTPPTHISRGGPTRGLAPRLPPPNPTASIGAADFGRDETFCAARPAKGQIRYVVNGRHVTLRVAMTALRPGADLGVEWHNAHSARGYTIASFRTDAAGDLRRHSLRMFRAGETRASTMSLATNADVVVARLRPCR